MFKATLCVCLVLIAIGCDENSSSEVMNTGGTTPTAGVDANQDAAGSIGTAGSPTASGGRTTMNAGQPATMGGSPIQTGGIESRGGVVATGGSMAGGRPTTGGEQSGGQIAGGRPTMGGEQFGGQISGGQSSPLGGQASGGSANIGGAATAGGMMVAQGGVPNANLGGEMAPGGGEAVLPMGGVQGPADNCPDEVFIDVAAFDGPGGNYPAPNVRVTCTDDTMTVRSNGIPHYTYVDQTPNGLQAQNYNWTLPLNPQYSQQTKRIPCLGTAGLSINGIPIFGPNEAQMPDPYGDPVANGVMDEAEGHSGRNGTYHYHALVESAFFDADGDGVPDLLDDERVPDAAGPSPILGFALDGFPIYGPRGCLDAACQRVVTFKSSYEHTKYEMGTVGCANSNACADRNAYVCAPTVINGQETTACVYKDYAWDYNVYQPQQGDGWLDECNGRIGPDGTYRYHATKTFPYLLGCYHGVYNANHDACPTDPNAGGNNDDPNGNENQPGDGPPEAAINACQGLAQGSRCSFQGRQGMDVNGTCRTPPNQNMLICVP